MSDPNPIRRRRVVTWDLWGWEEIADAINASEDTAQRYARRPDDANPLPVFKFGGRVAAKKSDISDWSEREAKRIRAVV